MELEIEKLKRQQKEIFEKLKILEVQVKEIEELEMEKKSENKWTYI